MRRGPVSSGPVAVVIGLDCITGLQTARLLSRRRVPVVGIAGNMRHFAVRTNACREIVHADTSGPQLLDALARLAARLPGGGCGGVLVPCTDNSVRVLSAHRSKLCEGYRLALPDHDVVEMLMSKHHLHRFAERHGFRVPATFDLHDRGDLERSIERIRFPCVLKPALKDPRWLELSPAKAYKAATADELVRLYEMCSEWSRHLMVQEWIEGPESELYSCNVYFDRASRPLVTFVARKIRQWPPQTGTSCLGVECRADEVLRETVRLFETVRFHGLGYVEMKRDTRTGEFVLIEPNVGRPTGRSAIAEAGGVELLHTMYSDLAGRPLPEARTQTYGDAKWIYLRRDLQASVHAWRRGELSLRQWLRTMRGSKAYAVLSLHDPWPFLHDTRRIIVKGLQTLSRRFRNKLRDTRHAQTRPT